LLVSAGRAEFCMIIPLCSTSKTKLSSIPLFSKSRFSQCRTFCRPLRARSAEAACSIVATGSSAILTKSCIHPGLLCFIICHYLNSRAAYFCIILHACRGLQR
jgi:hypothetical protein